MNCNLQLKYFVNGFYATLLPARYDIFRDWQHVSYEKNGEHVEKHRLTIHAVRAEVTSVVRLQFRQRNDTDEVAVDVIQFQTVAHRDQQLIVDVEGQCGHVVVRHRPRQLDSSAVRVDPGDSAIRPVVIVEHE